MKTLLTALILLTSMALNAETLSVSPQEPLPRSFSFDSQEKKKWNVNTYFGSILKGKVTINHMDQEVILTYDYGPYCGPNMVCPTVIYSHSVTLPLINVRRGKNNAIIYTAQKNNLPVDGTLETITITDYSQVPAAKPIYFGVEYIDGSTQPTHKTAVFTLDYNVKFWGFNSGSLVDVNAFITLNQL